MANACTPAATRPAAAASALGLAAPVLLVSGRGRGHILGLGLVLRAAEPWRSIEVPRPIRTRFLQTSWSALMGD